MANSKTGVSNGMSNDFRSILSTFRIATGTGTNPTSTNTLKRYKLSTLKERTERLWRIAQIRRASSVSVANMHACDRDDIHIAVCACIIDDFPQEHIWRAWIDTGMNKIDATEYHTTPVTKTRGKASAEMYIHAKSPSTIKSVFVQSKTIATTFRPEWNDVRIVRAMLALAKEALQEPATTHILFVTESCIPIATVLEVATELRNFKECSFMDAYGGDSTRCSRFDERQCWDILTPNVPHNAIYKTLPGWCMLSRRHMGQILDLPRALGDSVELWPAFENVWAPEEVYFPTVLALIGILPGKEVIPKSLMFAKWDEKAQNNHDRSHPFVYDNNFNEQLVYTVRQKGCFFMRKLRCPIDQSVWNRIVVRPSTFRFDNHASIMPMGKCYTKSVDLDKHVCKSQITKRQRHRGAYFSPDDRESKECYHRCKIQRQIYNHYCYKEKRCNRRNS